MAAANGSSKRLSFSVTYRGFLNKDIKFKSGSALVWGAQSPGETFGPTQFTTDQGTVSVSGSISGDVGTFSGSFSAPFDGINNDLVKAYYADLNLVFECNGEPILISNKTGGSSIKWGDPKGEVTDPECKYGGFFSGPTGCGSYISQVTDPGDGTVRYFAVGKVGSKDPKDFVGEWTTTNPIFNCTICAAKDCPSATINRIYISPPRPKVGEAVTAFVEFNVDKKGYQTLGDTTAVRLSGDGIPCITSFVGTFCERFQATGTFSLGPFDSEGTKTITASYEGYSDTISIFVLRGTIQELNIIIDDDISNDQTFSITTDEQIFASIIGKDAKGNQWLIDGNWSFFHPDFSDMTILSDPYSQQITFSPTMASSIPYTINVEHTELSTVISEQFIVYVSVGDIDNLEVEATDSNGFNYDESESYQITSDDFVQFSFTTTDSNGNDVQDNQPTWLLENI